MKQTEFNLTDLAYWVGVVQSDGSLKHYKNSIQISLAVSCKSLPMLHKFRELSLSCFNKHSNIWKERSRDLFDYHYHVKSLMQLFKYLDIKFGDPPKPPEWCLAKPSLFGAYLAGVIDGDGCIWLTKPKDYNGLVCRAKITCGSRPVILERAIESFLNCKTRIIKVKTDGLIGKQKISGVGYNLEFLISSKNYEFVKDYLLPYITIHHKYQRLKTYLEYRIGRNSIPVVREPVEDFADSLRTGSDSQLRPPCF